MTTKTNADESVKTYELRELMADDMFPMFNIISKIGIREFKSCFQSAEVMQLVRKLGNGEGNDNEETKDETPISLDSIGLTVAFDIAGILCANLPACKKDLYQLLSQLSGITEKEIAKLPMMTFTNMIIDVIKKEEFKDFFQGVAGLLK